MEVFDKKMALRSFFAEGIRHFLYANMAITSCKTEGYISAIIADMKMRASYNEVATCMKLGCIIADMKMRASYNYYDYYT